MANSNEHYQPVSCELHSQYELAIMHKSKLELSWVSGGELVTETNVQPLDVKTENKAEYLVAVTEKNENLLLRLDQITKMRILK